MLAVLEKLADRWEGLFEREIAQAMEEGRAGLDIGTVLGITREAMERGALDLSVLAGPTPADAPGGPAMAYAMSFARGEAAALRRAMAAISAPSAKGREVEILAAMIRETIPQPTPQPVTNSSNIVTLRAAEVTNPQWDNVNSI